MCAREPAFSQFGLHVIAKPIGPICNIACQYCFYLKKDELYPQTERWKMSDETLDAYVRQYIDAQPAQASQIDFAFQGGEPTLMGLDYFRRVLDVQARHVPPGKTIRNSLQTNGIRLDDAWCRFLRENRFLVGLSVDGPSDLHDRYRVDRRGEGTHRQVMEAMERLKRHGVEFNVLCAIHRFNADHPLRVYRFFRNLGVQFVQFIPIVVPAAAQGEGAVSAESVLPQQFGRFLSAVFDEWSHNDVGRVFVRDFDQALAAWLGASPTLCVYAKHCGRALAIEHNGDLFSCDHFVDLPHKLGNIHESTIGEMANSAAQEQFGRDKHDRLPQYCRQCNYLFACHGACPKDRISQTPQGERGLNFLCQGLKAFFEHIDPVMRAMAAEIRAGRPAAAVMQRLRASREQARQQAVGGGPIPRNAPCPCGSGRKYKACCARR